MPRNSSSPMAVDGTFQTTSSYRTALAWPSIKFSVGLDGGGDGKRANRTTAAPHGDRPRVELCWRELPGFDVHERLQIRRQKTGSAWTSSTPRGLVLNSRSDGDRDIQKC